MLVCRNDDFLKKSIPALNRKCLFSNVKYNFKNIIKNYTEEK